jgi:hypothetical protein
MFGRKYSLLLVLFFANSLIAQIPQIKIPKLFINSIEAEELYTLEEVDIREAEISRVIKVPVFWTETNKFSLQISEVAFSNWNGGGANSISALIGIDLERNYKDKNFKWDNLLIVRAGANKQSEQEVRKTEDRLEIDSKAGFKFKRNSNWYYLGRINFNTQFFNGFNFPNTTDIISQFMAPGYLLSGIGIEHKIKKENFYLYLSPITYKSTFVLDQNLANEGAFGVKDAIRAEGGTILVEGEKLRIESGILINNEYKKEIFESVKMESRLSLYTDYLNNFGNIDVDWELNFSFGVNDFIKATLGSHIRYDDDVKIRIEQEDGNVVQGGSRVQWKQQLGVGVMIEL